MTEQQSLQDCINRGFYRKLSNGKIIFTNGEKFFWAKEFAQAYEHFELIGKHKIYHELIDIHADNPIFPIIELTVDFSKPKGKIPNEPLLNIAPEPPIKSENNNKDTSIIWTHLENLCGDVEQDTKDWIKDWIADIFQNPINKPGTALSIRSDEGTGKGFFFDSLMHKLLGERHLSTSKSIAGERFNGWAKNKLLINFNEGSWDNSKDVIGVLKNFITDPDFSFEDKGKDIEKLPNYARVVFTTNATWAIKNDNSRRFCCLHTIKENYCTEQYFDNLWKTLYDEDLLKKFLYELETRKITHDLRVVPKTEEYFNQQTISRNHDESWLEEVLDNREICICGDEEKLLWINCNEKDWEDIKKCCPKTAEISYNELNGTRITSNKLFSRLKNCVQHFQFKVEYKVVKDDGHSVRIWEFERVSPLAPVSHA